MICFALILHDFLPDSDLFVKCILFIITDCIHQLQCQFWQGRELWAVLCCDPEPRTVPGTHSRTEIGHGYSFLGAGTVVRSLQRFIPLVSLLTKEVGSVMAPTVQRIRWWQKWADCTARKLAEPEVEVIGSGLSFWSPCILSLTSIFWSSGWMNQCLLNIFPWMFYRCHGLNIDQDELFVLPPDSLPLPSPRYLTAFNASSLSSLRAVS